MTSHQNIKISEKIMISKYQEDVKQPRACELCLNKHAVWYCASDDAFLCHVCDESVHSANHVATKHERVCLRTNEISNDVRGGTTLTSVWHSGFRRKARTPRSRYEKKPQQKIDDERRREDPRVPEIGGEVMFFIPEANDDDMTSLVPEFEGFTEMGFFLSNHNGTEETTKQFNFEEEADTMEDLYYNGEEEDKTDGAEACPGQYLMSCKKDYDNVITVSEKTEEIEDCYENNARHRLNYENVIAAWDKQESPRDVKNNTSSFQLVPPGIEEKRVRSEREARVWRYRDKRKNRLFEKKIRYEVRKVNADKRPRMKGRFVRRSLAIDS
ncbi:B-box type zinc finger protein with CCT domain-containing protein [Arabidopsis thaliana]|uniref:B-box type zinc finger protein with CCT domain-containing protein n=1 Tax=Arabidopsis thaliana TaxID=3702 RepID=F4I1N0_ARATH|nr:B-box type zinc finger protein with CCT domain-containing protein [Arabidopsis thaliana]AEE32393.1 B-box type zinc finger protein with CCT domain-containing protein [Arabidopsis thaliana]|eukprot:NP_175339.2 B-box type zinc finger protein with CCT domain-containing protein [Arabidopsis thaliana]